MAVVQQAQHDDKGQPDVPDLFSGEAAELWPWNVSLGLELLGNVPS